jgi:hypothetical protein
LNTQPYEIFTLGAATFDLSGLPKEYFTLAEGDNNISWVQTIFQALGLRSLLSSSLKLENFYYAIIRDKSFTALIVKQPSCYLALLVDLGGEAIGNNFINWARSLDPNDLKKNPRFRVLN